MNVGDLITWLQQYPEDREVYIQEDTFNCYPVSEFVDFTVTKGKEVAKFLALKYDWEASRDI